MCRALRSIICSRPSIACTAVVMLHLNLITTCFPAQPPVCHLCCYAHDAIVHCPLHVQREETACTVCACWCNVISLLASVAAVMCVFSSTHSWPAVLLSAQDTEQNACAVVYMLLLRCVPCSFCSCSNVCIQLRIHDSSPVWLCACCYSAVLLCCCHCMVSFDNFASLH